MSPFVFIDQRSMGLVSILIFLSLACSISPSYGYDSLDPNGNITIKWDILQTRGHVYDAIVSIFNYQLYRHIEPPGWKLSWEWPHGEVIWRMLGAETTMQGNCSKFHAPLPHCCDRKPAIIDLLSGAPLTRQYANCCKHGVMFSMTQDPDGIVSSFEFSVGDGNVSVSRMKVPARSFDIGVAGYSCGEALVVDPPSRFAADGGRRWTQALRTWNVTCTYAQHQVLPSPTCCVSLTAFYSSDIVPCARCSCACKDLSGAKCVKADEMIPTLQLPKPVIMCTNHMCPIRIHWHVKESYSEYWRVKITIQNLNYATNYSRWNLEVQHPNVKTLVRVFSFNHQILTQHGSFNDTAMFWGIKSYNDMLLTAERNGIVQTELLFRKDHEIFTFKNGWAFPRRVSFNGDECVLPPPDKYPGLPGGGGRVSVRASLVHLVLALLLIVLL